MDLKKELDICIRSRFPLIFIVSYEEERIIDVVGTLCEQRKVAFYLWDHADFFQKVGGDSAIPRPAKDPLTVLESIESVVGNQVFLLRDFHQVWDKQPRVIRKLRNLAQTLKYTKKTVIVTAPSNIVPQELRHSMVTIELPPPGREELATVLDGLLSAPAAKVDIDITTRGQIIQAAIGLSTVQAQRVFAKAIVSHGVLDERDIRLINAEKRDIIRESGALEYCEPSNTLADVGGLEILKAWLDMRERAFSQAARDYGLPEPKGILLIGVPGTGKSLTAKMIASHWHLPLIRLDVGALFGEFVGASERNVRRALNLAETVAPCVLWIDEIEKGLSTGTGDGGTSQRVFASMLSWMQEKQKPVFLVATANDISNLPPELLRRGRFDEIFFLDLPTTKERQEIFEVHLRKRGRTPACFDIAGLSAAAEGYVGAEIEQSITDGMFVAFSDADRPGRELDTDDIRLALEKLVPMSHSQQETIDHLRNWLMEGRFQSASFRETLEAQARFVPIEV